MALTLGILLKANSKQAREELGLTSDQVKLLSRNMESLQAWLKDAGLSSEQLTKYLQTAAAAMAEMEAEEAGLSEMWGTMTGNVQALQAAMGSKQGVYTVLRRQGETADFAADFAGVSKKRRAAAEAAYTQSKASQEAAASMDEETAAAGSVAKESANVAEGEDRVAESATAAAGSVTGLDRAMAELAAENPEAAAALQESALTQAKMADAALAASSAITEETATTKVAAEQSAATADVQVAANDRVAESAESTSAVVLAANQRTAESARLLAIALRKAGNTQEQVYRGLTREGFETNVATGATALAFKGLGKEAQHAGRELDYMTGAMAYGTARAAAFGANLGPVGYVIGSVARASERLAPILSSLFGVAIGFMAVEMVGKFVSSLEQAHIKLEQTEGQLIAWGAAQDKAASQAHLLTLQLQQQIAKLEGIPVPDALQVALTKDKIAADALAQSLGQAAQQTIGMMSKAAPAWYQKLGSYADVMGGALAFAAGSMHLFAQSAVAAGPKLASFSMAENDILSATLSLEKITDAEAKGTVAQSHAYEQERLVLKQLISELRGLAHQQGLTEGQQLALTEAARGYEDELIRLDEAQKQRNLNARLERDKAAKADKAAHKATHKESLAHANKLAKITSGLPNLYAALSPAQKAMAAASHGMNVHTMTMGEWGRVSKAANEAAMQHAATMAASAPGIHGGNVALEQLGAHADRLRLTKNEIAQLNVLLPQFGKNFQLNMGLATQAIRSFQAIAPRTMEEFSQALGKNIAMAILYGASVTKAMERALKGILASITAQAAVKAILETAKGFEYLADRMYPQAALAFKSAALYGSIGAAAGAIASAIPGGGGGGRGAGRGTAGYGAERGGGPPGVVGGYREAGAGGGNYHQTVVNIIGGQITDTHNLQNLITTLNQGGQSGVIRLNIAGSSNTIPTPSY